VKNLREEIATIHKAGAKVVYTMCTGVMPLVPAIKKLDFDCFFGVEPALGNQDMKVIAKEIGGSKAIWSGLSAPIHIGEGTPDIVRKAVREAFDTFGKTGFILAPVPSVRPEWPWENLTAMIDEWKKLR
jgi:uroporphyrinogen-III decarboxylase